MNAVKTEADELFVYLWWFTAAVLVALGVMVARESWWATIPLVLIGVAICPLIFSKLQEKAKLKDRINIRMPIVLLTLCGATYLLFTQDAIIKARKLADKEWAQQQRVATEKRENREREAKLNAEELAAYQANSEQFLAEIDKAIEAKDIATSQRIIARFHKVAKDPRLDVLAAKFETMKRQVEQDAAIAELQAKAKALGANDYKQAVDIYTKLSVLDPENPSYKAKIARYEKIWNEQVARDLAATAAAAEKVERGKKIEAQFSGWDGSHRDFERLIKDAMNDPDSYEHVETRYRDMGKYIRVYCTFRGKNAFGGMVKNTKVADFDLEGNFVREIQ